MSYLLPEASFSLQVLLLPKSVCVCECLCVCVCEPLACLHDNSSPAPARIIQFGPEMQNTLIKIPMV